MSNEKQPSARARRKANQVVFHTYPKLVFAWPLILAGFLFYPLDALIGPQLLGWFYVFIMAGVVMTIGVDIDRNLAVFWLAIFGFLVFAGMWLQDAKQFTLIGDLYDWLFHRNVEYSRGLGLGVSLMLTPPYIVMVVWTHLQHKWRVTHNEFEHYAWGRADDSLARGAKRVRITFPDWLEFVLLGSGTLIVYSATGRQELRRIPHVPMIIRVKKKINRLLESQQVTIKDHSEMLAAEEVEAEEEEAAQQDAATGTGGSLDEHTGGVKDPL